MTKKTSTKTSTKARSTSSTTSSRRRRRQGITIPGWVLGEWLQAFARVLAAPPRP